MGVLQVLAVLEPLAVTAVYFPSSTGADDTTAAPEFDPGDHGVHLLQVTIKINCMVTVEEQNVRFHFLPAVGLM